MRFRQSMYKTGACHWKIWTGNNNMMILADGMQVNKINSPLSGLQDAPKISNNEWDEDKICRKATT